MRRSELWCERDKDDETDRRYYNGWGIPRFVPEGRVLAHNHIMHTGKMQNGVNGFRCWTWPQDKVPSNFKPCQCGWSGLPHVAMYPDVACISNKELMAME